MIRYGFACKAIGVPGTAQSSLTLSRTNKEKLLTVSRQNLSALKTMLEYCHAHSISLLRISSDIIPLASHPDVSFAWKRLLLPELATVAQQLHNSGVRVSMHPGQYTILNSPRAEVVERAIDDLCFHATFLDAIGAPQTARIILHIGGAYGNKQEALERFKSNTPRLPEHVLQRLALENDDRIYTIEEVLQLCERFTLPAVFDVFHHILNPPSAGSLEQWLDRSAKTWNASTSGRQKIHYSQQMDGGKPGSHSKSILMHEFLPFHHSLGNREVDVMLEVKDKNLSAVKCTNLTTTMLPRQRLTVEWAKYKYLVLERDQAEYLAIRELLKAEQPDCTAFYRCIENALAQQAFPGQAINAAQHVWGYVNTFASPAESQRIQADIAALKDSLAPLGRLKRKLLRLAVQHSVSYLENSLYFYL